MNYIVELPAGDSLFEVIRIVDNDEEEEGEFEVIPLISDDEFEEDQNMDSEEEE